MKAEEAAKLREFWRQCTDWICYHPIVVGIRTEQGALTGNYVCTRCGEEVYRRHTEQPTESRP